MHGFLKSFMRHVEEEVKDSRLTTEALSQLVEEQKQSEVKERKVRAEQARQRTETRIRLDSEVCMRSSIASIPVPYITLSALASFPGGRT